MGTFSMKLMMDLVDANCCSVFVDAGRQETISNGGIREVSLHSKTLMKTSWRSHQINSRPQNNYPHHSCFREMTHSP
jgi:hypothetical protein